VSDSVWLFCSNTCHHRGPRRHKQSSRYLGVMVWWSALQKGGGYGSRLPCRCVCITHAMYSTMCMGTWEGMGLMLPGADHHTLPPKYPKPSMLVARRVWGGFRTHGTDRQTTWFLGSDSRAARGGCAAHYVLTGGAGMGSTSCPLETARRWRM
jgi:hypothetical protein